jgi:hypothetical protein
MKGKSLEVLHDIPFELDFEILLAKLHLRQGTDDAKEVENLVDTIRTYARPKAIYKVSYIEERRNDNIRLDGATFTSRVLRTNLDKIERVFPFVATCGREVDELNLCSGDILKEFWVDQIKEIALRCSCRYLHDYLCRKYALGKFSIMSPGSGDVTVWPIEQQRILFSLFGDVKKLIGVELTDSFLMVPKKSVSGIIFPTERDFRSCRLCHRKNCPSRSAPFDEILWQRTQHYAGENT